MSQLLLDPHFSEIDDNGDPLSGGLVYTYENGTTTDKETYTTATLAVAHANPVVLNTRGEAIIYLSGIYTIVVTDSAGGSIWTADNVEGQGSTIIDFHQLSEYADLATAVATIAATETTLYIDADDTMGANVTIPATLTVIGMNGHSITTTGFTLTSNGRLVASIGLFAGTGAVVINGPFEAGVYQVFSGTDTVTFGEDACTEIYPEWWGVDGTADNVQIQQAIESASGLNGATIKLLPKDYNTVATITVNRDRINILGSGEHATRIVFAPTAADVCMEWDEGGTMISQCTIRDLTFYTNDTTWDKDAMRLEDIDIFEMKNVQISGSDVNGWTGGTESIGLQIQGRNIGSIQNVNIKADVPISIEDNPNNIIDIDHFNFNNLYLTSKSDNTFPCVRVANGVNLTNVTFDGVQAWIYGSYGFYWVDTTTITVSLNLSFNNVRHEQSTNVAAYIFYIDHNVGLQNLSFNNIYGGLNINGYYFRNVESVTIKNSYYQNITNLIALNIDVSVRDLNIVNSFWQAGTTLTSSGQTLVSGILQAYGPIPTNAAYQDTTRQATPHLLSDAPLSGTILTLADHGKAEIAQDSFVGYAFIASSSSYPALYVINGLNATVAEINDPGTLYTVTENNDTTTNIYWDAVNARYEINNEEGASRDYYITLIGRTR